MKTYRTRVRRPDAPQKAPSDAFTPGRVPNSALAAMMEEEALHSLPSRQLPMSQDLTQAILDRFSVPLSGLRIYEDQGLGELGQTAYAQGNEIHFARGQFKPTSERGRELFLHEAGHIVQQGSGMVPGSGIVENSALESQADAGFTAPSSFSMPASAQSAPIQGGERWDEFKENMRYKAFKAADIVADDKRWNNLPWYKKAALVIRHPFAYGRVRAGSETFARERDERSNRMGTVMRRLGLQGGGNSLAGTDAESLSPQLLQEQRGGGEPLSEVSQENVDPSEVSEPSSAVPQENADASEVSAPPENATAADTDSLPEAAMNNDKTNEFNSSDRGAVGGKLSAASIATLIAGVAAGTQQASHDRLPAFVRKIMQLITGKEPGNGVLEEGATLRGAANGSAVRADASLSPLQKIAGNVSGGLTAGAGVLSLISNSMGVHDARKKGNHYEAFQKGMGIIGDMGTIGGGVWQLLGANMGPAMTGLAGRIGIPGTGILTGAAKAASGISRWREGVKTKHSMEELQEQMKMERKKKGLDLTDLTGNSLAGKRYKTMSQAMKMADITRNEGIYDTTGGILNAGGSVMKLTGLASLWGTLVSGLGSGLGLVKFLHSRKSRKDLRTSTVNEELGLDNKINKIMSDAKEHGDKISRKDAKHMALQSMGFATGKRKEAFMRITMNRAYALQTAAQRALGKNDATVEDQQALKIVEGMQLHPVDGKFNLQGIAEKLGVEAGSWQKQLKESQERD